LQVIKMNDESNVMEMEKQEVALNEEMERTRECPCYIPRADIYETDEQIVVVADMPGATPDSVEILLEKDFLALSSNVDLPDYAGYTLVYGEYEVGDYQRRFKLSDAIDREQIEAVVRDGVLQLTLPKAAPAKAKKISVRAG
jgi:HSP20 family molecular chaperone IbpA